jgi:hypothetical protein
MMYVYICKQDEVSCEEEGEKRFRKGGIMCTRRNPNESSREVNPRRRGFMGGRLELWICGREKARESQSRGELRRIESRWCCRSVAPCHRVWVDSGGPWATRMGVGEPEEPQGLSSPRGRASWA